MVTSSWALVRSQLLLLAGSSNGGNKCCQSLYSAANSYTSSDSLPEYIPVINFMSFIRWPKLRWLTTATGGTVGTADPIG